MRLFVCTIRPVWYNVITETKRKELQNVEPFHHPAGALRHVKAHAPTSMSLKGDQKVWKKLEALAGQLHRQQQTRSALKDRLRSVAYACSTRKALLAALPEFEKYLPEDEPAALRTLPVVANVVADFVKAGWPKAAAPRQASAAT